MFETQKSGNKTSSWEIGLNIRTLASPKVGQDQVCWHAALVANVLWKPLAIGYNILLIIVKYIAYVSNNKFWIFPDQATDFIAIMISGELLFGLHHHCTGKRKQIMASTQSVTVMLSTIFFIFFLVNWSTSMTTADLFADSSNMHEIKGPISILFLFLLPSTSSPIWIKIIYERINTCQDVQIRVYT